MINFECIIQEGTIGAELRPELVAGFEQVCSAILGESPESVQILFTEIPKGWGVQGGSLSRASLLLGYISSSCESHARTQLMANIEKMWLDVTGCAVDEVTVMATDRVS